MADFCHVVVVSDEPELQSMLGDFLQRHGYAVTSVAGGEGLRRVFAERAVDLVVIDIELPGECGVALTRYLHRRTRVGIVALTGKKGPVDPVVPLEAGADDCLVRPVDLRELLARTRAVTRRIAASPVDLVPTRVPPGRPVVSFGRCRLDLEACRLVGEDGEDIPITAMEYALLRALAEHPGRAGRALSGGDLAERAHPCAWSRFERSSDIRISRLRKKIEPNPVDPCVIETVRGVGYRFAAAA